jgi:hypothetical protein
MGVIALLLNTRPFLGFWETKITATAGIQEKPLQIPLLVYEKKSYAEKIRSNYNNVAKA